jgi:hypothetical protein
VPLILEENETRGAVAIIKRKGGDVMQSGEKRRNNEELSKEMSELIKKIKQELSTEEIGLLCQVDTECPPGYVCAFGKCVKKIV